MPAHDRTAFTTRAPPRVEGQGQPCYCTSSRETRPRVTQASLRVSPALSSSIWFFCPLGSPMGNDRAQFLSGLPVPNMGPGGVTEAQYSL